MSALPAPRIDSVNWNNGEVTFTVLSTGVQYTRHYFMLKKNALIKACSFVGIRFTGVPMHKELFELQNAFGDRIAEGKDAPPSPKIPKEELMPTPSTPDVNVALDALLEAVKANATPNVSKDEILDIVMPKIDEVTATVGDLALAVKAEFDSLESRVALMVPKVVQIHLPNHEIIKLDGVQHFQFPKVLAHISVRNHVMMVGKAGSGKTSIAEQASQALGLEFSSKSCTSQTTESSLVGFINATGHYVTTEFRKRFETGGVFLLDEIDNANPNVLGVLNAALANTTMGFPDGMIKRHPDFVALAAGNTFGNGATAEYVGRNPIDKATKDRFMVMGIDYDTAIEDAMVTSVGLDPMLASKWLLTVRQARMNIDKYGLKIVVSPRSAFGGAKMLRTGAFTNDEIIEQSILKGTKPEQATKVLEGVSF